MPSPAAGGLASNARIHAGKLSDLELWGSMIMMLFRSGGAPLGLSAGTSLGVGSGNHQKRAIRIMRPP